MFTSEQLRKTLALISVIALLVSGCDSAPTQQIAVPATPTASTNSPRENHVDFPVDSKPAFLLLRQTQAAMSSVSGYHFTLDNSMDTDIRDSNDTFATIGTTPPLPTFAEGDVVPPIAGFSDKQGLANKGYLIVGQERYGKLSTKVSGSNLYTKIDVPADDWYILNGALNNPQQFINYALDTAVCARLMEDATIGGVDTTHLRFILSHDELGAKATDGLLVYARDIWIEKKTHYLKQVQVWELDNIGHPCEVALSLTPNSEDVLYTTGILTYSLHNQPNSPLIPVTPLFID